MVGALGLLCLPIAFGEAHFKRFPETVTNDGAYVLAWGIQDDPAGGMASKTEVPADGPEKLGDIDSDNIEDYLVDTASGKIVATIPNFTYFAGSEGRENHYNLEVGWSPDNHGGIAVYQARYATAAVAWIQSGGSQGERCLAANRESSSSCCGSEERANARPTTRYRFLIPCSFGPDDSFWM